MLLCEFFNRKSFHVTLNRSGCFHQKSVHMLVHNVQSSGDILRFVQGE